MLSLSQNIRFMIEYLSANMWQAWTVVAVLCLIAELSTGGFFVMCFAIGGLAAALVSPLCGIYLQLAAFVVVSVGSIFMVRPFALKYLHLGNAHVVSNADAIIGRTGRVSQAIPRGDYGRVAIDGDDWKAQSSAATADIPEGAMVKVVARESIIIDVTPIN